MTEPRVSEIIARLQKKGLRIEDIASRTGISYETIQRYKNNNSVPYPLYLKSLQNLETELNAKSE